ncbi:MAG: leucine-rich repeat domain-containing protein, partial [Prevotella sp.]|nr:leucine-rich repeat domain-containing protein [Prevotella sp.]
DVSKNTTLTNLYCSNNQLTTLDVSKNTALTSLYCYNNQLTALDVSKNTALTSLECVYNQLTTLDVSKNTALTSLYCYNNQLTALDVSKNTALTYLCCYNNQIKGAKMDALIASLPTVEYGSFDVIDTKDANEGNVCTNTQVNAAKAKGWTVYDNNGNHGVEYEGSDELILNEDNFTDSNFRATLSQILGISEDDEITPEMIDEITTLNVSNKTISNLKGIEHFKELMVLYCQLNQIKGADMDDLIVSLPTIDTSSAAPALNAPRKTSGTWGSLYAYDNTAGNEGNVITTEQVADANAKGWKVYQFNGTAWEEYAGSTTGITIVENNDDAIANWYTLDGKRLYGEPVTKGVYVVEMSNGLKKKVMVK